MFSMVQNLIHNLQQDNPCVVQRPVPGQRGFVPKCIYVEECKERKKGSDYVKCVLEI